MKKFISLFLVLISFISITFSQSKNQSPKLVVGIVVDQMRYDYLYKFKSLYSENGFKKLMKEGSNFTFAHFNYAPTYTGVGHASIYTGTTPFFNGIISNEWYNKKTKEMIYCTSDKNYSTVGADNDKGKMSPKLLLSTTITDQLKLSTNGHSKVIGISIKDRASIIPAGHNPNGAFWYDKKTGHFITSSYYMDKLPQWVKDFNQRNLVEKYMSNSWQLSYPLEKYVMSMPDKADYEIDEFKEDNTTFPHKFNNLSIKEKRDLIRTTPFANKLLYDLTLEAIKNERLGKGKYTDFLAISFSATDYIGHSYGPNSVEVEDTYIKLDKLISELIKKLDKTVGKGKYILFLTGDHAVAENPTFLKKHNMPGGWYTYNKIKKALIKYSNERYGQNLIENISNRQIFLNRKKISSKGLLIESVRKKMSDFLINKFNSIAQIYTRDDLIGKTAYRKSPNLILNGFNPSRSGDIAIEFQPGLSSGTGKGHAATHGSIYSYDTHVPLLFYGWNIPNQTINKPVYIVDIAPTIADLLNIMEPSANMGIPLIKRK